MDESMKRFLDNMSSAMAFQDAIRSLDLAGIVVQPCGDVPGLYTAPGYPELTRGQVLGLACQVSAGHAAIRENLRLVAPSPSSEG